METLSALINMLRPQRVFTKVVTGSGQWGVSYSGIRTAGFGLVLRGNCYLRVGGTSVYVRQGDFVLMPSADQFSMSNEPGVACIAVLPHELGEPPQDRHHGNNAQEPDFRMLGGFFWFDPTNASLMRGLLPALLLVDGSAAISQRIRSTIELLADEATSQRAGRELVACRLVEILLVETLRLTSTGASKNPLPGLIEGMLDLHLAAALRCIHENIAHHWTVAELARNAGLSRSAFSDRFSRKIGMPPMEYVLLWRMALAKDMLRSNDVRVDRVASQLGYQSASAFSAAFTREVGLSPSRFARQLSALAVDDKPQTNRPD